MAIDRGLTTVEQVQFIIFFRNFSENTDNEAHPDFVDVEEAIDFVIDEMNAILLTAGYTLPITLAASPYGYRYLAYMNAMGAACNLESRYGTNDSSERFCSAYADMKKSLTEQTVILADVPGAPSPDDLAKSGTSQVLASGDEREPFFTRIQNF